jgi:hypothetical protein
MAATPESKVKAKIKAILVASNAYFAMPIGSMYGNSGVPDFLCCVGGRFVAIEAKAGKGRTTALQDKHLEQIRQRGGYALIVNESNLHELEQLMREINDGRPRDT